jgi:prepilin signal peptidase PulO-like enzyme (type II secretory pathway)
MIMVILVLLGICFGSFVNALVWRLYQQSLPKKKRAASDGELSISKGRSMCPHCQHTLAWYDLLPVISWASLGGKCRYCLKSISWQYPVVELASALLFVASYIWWPYTFDDRGVWLLIIWLTSLIGLIALVIYDIKWMLLPNKIVFPLLAIAVAGVLGDVFVFNGGLHSLLMALASLAIAGGIFYMLFQLSAGKWIGGGDVKLGFALGLLLGGPGEAFLMLFFASILGLLFSLPVVLLKKSKLSSKIPFGPFLILATIIVKLFGGGIMTWYTRTFLYL